MTASEIAKFPPVWVVTEWIDHPFKGKIKSCEGRYLTLKEANERAVEIRDEYLNREGALNNYKGGESPDGCMVWSTKCEKKGDIRVVVEKHFPGHGKAFKKKASPATKICPTPPSFI